MTTESLPQNDGAHAEGAANGHLNGTANRYPDIVTSDITTGVPSPNHREQLEGESAISPEAIAARGYFTQTDKQALIHLGFEKYQALPPALVIPLYDWKGDRAGYALRPDIPRRTSRKHPVKYETQKGASPVLDVAPLTRDLIGDTSKPLIITEGAKKADSAASRGLCAINLNGVYGFRDKNTALPDWENIPLNGRVVCIAYDSDVATKPQVEYALRRLAALLHSRGAVVKIVYFPDGGGSKKIGLDDFFAQGGTVAEMYSFARDLEAIEESKRKRKAQVKAERLAQFQAAGKPIAETYDRPLPDILTDFSNAIARHNGSTPTLFHGVSGLQEIKTNAAGVTILEAVESARLQVIAAQNTTWTKTKSEAALPCEVVPTQELCNQFITSQEYWENIPPIERVLTAPFIDRDGNVCDRRGYHASEAAWLTLPDGYSLPDTTPTPDNITASKTIIDKLFSEVAFTDEASRANATGLLLLPFVRLYINGLKDGQTPLHLFDAPTQSSGKTYAAQICLSPFSEAIPTSDKAKKEESEKEIFSLLVEGASYVFIDNVRSSLSSATIATAITSGKMRGRVLGITGTRTVSTNIVWVATSNNAQLDADAVSRSVFIPLDTNSETPEDREFAFNPIHFIAENRGEVQAAILTLVRAWLEAGRPERTKKVSRFPAWERVIGGILETIGVRGFLDNHKTARENTDPETNAWCGFIEAWYDAHGEHFKTVKELLETPEADDLKNLIGEKDTSRIFGKQLQTRKNKIIRGYKITKEDAGEKRRAVNRWRLMPIISQNDQKTTTETTGDENTGGSQKTAGDRRNEEKRPVLGYGTD